jgi:hypothetical protein
MRVTRTFSLDTETDRDILRWLAAQDNVSAAIREVIRAHQGHGGVTLGDVYQAVKELECKLQAGVAVGTSLTGGNDWDEPLEAVAALDSLGL